VSVSVGRRRSVAAVALLAALAALACACGDSYEPPTPTGATCPEDSTLTYENFGRPFMESYCVRCHSSELHGADRNGAPLYHDFDSLFGILAVANHVDWYTAAGPEAVNTLMPPDGDTPTIDERYQLGEWLACEVERGYQPPDAGPGPDAASMPDAGPSPDAP